MRGVLVPEKGQWRILELCIYFTSFYIFVVFKAVASNSSAGVSPSKAVDSRPSEPVSHGQAQESRYRHHLGDFENWGPLIKTTPDLFLYRRSIYLLAQK